MYRKLYVKPKNLFFLVLDELLKNKTPWQVFSTACLPLLLVPVTFVLSTESDMKSKSFEFSQEEEVRGNDAVRGNDVGKPVLVTTVLEEISPHFA